MDSRYLDRTMSSMCQLFCFVAQMSLKVKLVAVAITAITQLISLTNNKSRRTLALLVRTSMMVTLVQGNLTLVMEMKRTQAIQAIHQAVTFNQAVTATSTRRRKTISYTNFVIKLQISTTWHPTLNEKRNSTIFKVSFNQTLKLPTSSMHLLLMLHQIHKLSEEIRLIRNRCRIRNT